VSRDDWELAGCWVVLLALGVVLGAYGAFLVPLRLFDGVEGLAPVVGLLSTFGVGLAGALGAGSAPLAVAPGIGWIVSVLVLGYSFGGDVVVPGRLGTDPGIGLVGTLYLASGLVGLLAAGVVAARRLRNG
jgi:hypothetical protein